MRDRVLLYAIGASILAHGFVLGLGGGLRAPAPDAPRLLEARLVRESVPEKKVEAHPARAEQPEPARHAKVRTRPEPVQPQQRLVSEARREHPAPAVATASVPSMHAVSQPAAAPGPIAPAAGAPSQADAPVSYSPPSFGARYLDNPKPSYPLIARRRGLEGTVRLDVRVSAEGIPIAVRVRESGGHESLDDAALTAVWHWRFVPARRGGEPVEASVVVPVRFRLGSDEAG